MCNRVIRKINTIPNSIEFCSLFLDSKCKYGKLAGDIKTYLAQLSIPALFHYYSNGKYKSSTPSTQCIN